MDTISSPDYTTISRHEFAEVRQNNINEQKALFSLRQWMPGEVLADFSAGTISSEPTYLTVQIDDDKHITLQPEFLQYINHSCEPNVFFDTTLMQLVALREIGSNEEFVFFYPSSEWDMTQSFHCHCGSMNCIGEIKGAAHLSRELIPQYRFTDFIKSKQAKRKAKKVA
ncbi:MAG: SET domain-containing protein-lysine N-methyltransferase [Chitinophagaceae bacterium]|nr:SET domain-containing protein-lysine N-methyltransferase [Chitinophagaceae bacterium]